MQVQRIQYDYSNSKKCNISKLQNSNFQGGMKQLTALSDSSFQSENAKKIYSKIQRYIQLIGNNGSIKNVKILKDKWRDFNSTTSRNVDNDVNLLLSIDRNVDKTHISLSREYPDKSTKVILNVLLNKNGQMIRGLFPLDNLQFERYGSNVRRMVHRDRQYLPVRSNDREWDYYGSGIAPYRSVNFLMYHPESKKDNIASGAFELFLELARRYTSIM